MEPQKEKEDSGQAKAAMIGGVFVLLAACVSGVFLIINTLINNQASNISPTQSNSLTAPSTFTFQSAINPTSGDCQESNGQSLSSLPYAPSTGCILIVEWWTPPNAFNCGILITTGSPNISRNASGMWWNINPSHVESRVQGYLQVNPGCKVDDQR